MTKMVQSIATPSRLSAIRCVRPGIPLPEDCKSDARR